MFHSTNKVILILFIYQTQVHSFEKLDGQKRQEIRPRYHDVYRECRHEICNWVEEYPEMKILEAMNNKKFLKSILGIVLNSTYDITTVGNRDGFLNLGEGRQLCKTDGPTTHIPRVMRNLNLEWKFVVNVKGYPQIFTSEICRDGPAFGKALRRRHVKNDYCSEFGFKCGQSYQDIFLLVFEDGFIDFDRFSVPTTCNCLCG